MTLQSGLRAIQVMDLEDVRRDLMDAVKGPGFTMNRAEEAIDGYRAFLSRHLADPENDDNPTSDVDQVWHFHILRSRQYHADCLAIFGSYLHHSPDKPVPAELQDGSPGEIFATCGSGGGQSGGGGGGRMPTTRIYRSQFSATGAHPFATRELLPM